MPSIKKEIVRGVFWIAIAKYSGIIIQLIITAVLARLISPADFGTIAIAVVILQFLNIFADIGIGPAVVQFKQLTRHHLCSLFTLNLYIGVVLALILLLLSGLISSFYGNASLETACRLMSLVIFFTSLNVVPNALMRKEKRFRTIALRTLSFQLISGCIAVWGAYQGWGIYALLVSPILTALGVFGVNYYNYPLRFTFRISKDVVGKVSSFSFFQFAFAFFNYFSRNLDKLIIGRYFSLSQLGYYDKSYHLMQLPVQNITFVIEPVLHPILSSLQDNKHELGQKNIKLAKIISNISFPIGIILFLCAGELIEIIYGNQWNAAIPVFRILALSLPLQMIQSTSGAIYQAAGKTNHMFYNGIINTSITVTGFIIATFWGNSIESLAWAWDITLLINFIDSYFILNRYTIHTPVFSFFKALLPQLCNTSFTFIVMLLLIDFICINSPFWSLLVKLMLSLIVTGAYAYVFKQYNVIKLLSEFKFFNK